MEEKPSRFEELLLPHLDTAYNLARRIVGRDQDAQDIVQEAFVRALKGFSKFRGDNARAWLLVIVRNTAYTWIKKHLSHPNVIPFDPAIHTTTIDKPTPETFYEDRQRLLSDAINKLPIELREILVLRDIEGWSYKQLASVLNIPPGTVMSRLNRARQRIREEVAELQHKELEE